MTSRASICELSFVRHKRSDHTDKTPCTMLISSSAHDTANVCGDYLASISLSILEGI